MFLRLALAFIVVLGSVTHCPQADEREGRTSRAEARLFWSLTGGVYLSGMGDWLTTARFRERGVEEANPVIGSSADSPAAMAAIKLGGGTLVNYASQQMRKDGNRFWAVPQIVWIALNVAVSLHNANATE
ncbi:MAG TPA: hypothetical protein VGK94_07020 [Candidatus Polarisedimenticolia bacterium]|jgi:hypothetical protein